MEYQFNCTQPSNLKLLEYMIDNNREIKVETFKRKLGSEEFNKFARAMGYNRDFKLEDDWAVTYHSGKLPKGKPFLFIRHSSIEYVYY